MSDDSDNSNYIIYLEIEETIIYCMRDDLINNSDYFKAMLEGNFVERDQNCIKIEGVELNAVKIILKLLYDEAYHIREKDIYSVLQASCMLQFEKVKRICLEKVTDWLRLDNCIKIFTVTELLSIKPLYLHAKLLALLEFEEVKGSKGLLEMTLEQLLDYLGNIYLKCDRELTVFETSMEWWKEHVLSFADKTSDTLIKILSCLDFKNLNDNDFNCIMEHPYIRNIKNVMQVLSTVRHIKNDEPISEIPDCVQEMARLLYQTKSRISPSYIAILVKGVHMANIADGKSPYPADKHRKDDEHKHKHFLFDLDSPKPDDLRAVYYDEIDQKFKTLFLIDQLIWKNLDGFKIIGYKELVLLFGGQYKIGKGDFNDEFLVYEEFCGRWYRKTHIRFLRRHFEACIVDNKVFVAGGIGAYRIIQDDAFFYDYKWDKWSCPRVVGQTKCCNFLNKCFFTSLVLERGYFWDDCGTSILIDASVDKEVLKQQTDYAIFSYKDKLFIKGKHLLEFELKGHTLLMKSPMFVTNLDFDKLEVIRFNDKVYTFYKYTDDGLVKFAFEILDLQSRSIRFIFKDLEKDKTIGLDDNCVFFLNGDLKIFSVNHYTLVEKLTLINTAFRDNR